MKEQIATPIFIHSLFRSGSTYIFNNFRESKSNYWCYQEPLHEELIQLFRKPARPLNPDKENQTNLRHPKLLKPYFYEFHDLANNKNLPLSDKLPYKQYFTSNNNEITALNNYFFALIKGAQGRPVLQCCRTIGRVKNIRLAQLGVHIFLYRNPWDQWWSYKQNGYFDRTNLLIANAEELPKYMETLKEELKTPSFRDPDINKELDYFYHHRTSASDSYMLFYALWCYAILEAKPQCDLSIDIDELSLSKAYRQEIQERLESISIDGLDFSDCSVPLANYGESDGAFFLDVETHIHHLLLANGYSKEQVSKLEELSNKRKKSLADTSLPENSGIRDAMRAREYARQSEADRAERQSLILNIRAHAETKAHQAEARTEQLKAQIQQTEAKALQAETNVHQAEARTEQLKVQTQQLENELQGIFNSKSWRITWPLRKSMHLLRCLGKTPTRPIFRIIRALKKAAHNSISMVIEFIQRRPQLRSRIILKLNRHPSIKIRIKAFLNNKALNPALHETRNNPTGLFNDKNSGAKNSQHDDEKYPYKSIGYGGNSTHRIKSQGSNDKNKTPLEKWFY